MGVLINGHGVGVRTRDKAQGVGGCGVGVLINDLTLRDSVRVKRGLEFAIAHIYR